MTARRRAILIIIPIALALALLAQGLRVLRAGGDSLELAPCDPDTAGVEATRALLDRRKMTLHFDGTPLGEAFNFARELFGVRVTCSPAVDRALEDAHGFREITMKMENVRYRDALESWLRAAGDPEDPAHGQGRLRALVTKAKRAIRKEKGALRYRVYPDRIHCRFEDEPLPPGFTIGETEDEFAARTDGAPMVWVSKTDEKPGFLVDKYEVTVSRYRRFLESIARDGHARCSKSEPKDKDHRPDGWGSAEYAKLTSGDDGPVLGVDGWDARAYAAWAEKRIPSAMEWTRAAGDELYPWGREPVAQNGLFRANALGDRDGFLFAAPVGSFPAGASPFGALDMAGNAWELTRAIDPPCDDVTNGRADMLLKGGSFDSGEAALERAFFTRVAPDARARSYGFRCVTDWPKE